MIKNGLARGKQRYLCTECYHKFTYDLHMITSFLKIDVDEFIEICIDTLTMVPIHKTAARLNRSIKCIFLNRHKFLSMLEKYLESEKIQLSGTIECDETYVLESSALKNQSGSGRPSEISRGQILTSFLTTWGIPYKISRGTLFIIKTPMLKFSLASD